MLSGKQYLLIILLMAVVLVPISALVETFKSDLDIQTVGQSELTSELNQPAKPLYIEVLSRDCHSADCTENHKVLGELASEYRGRIKFLRVFVEDVPDAERILGVHGTPSGVLIVPQRTTHQQSLDGDDGGGESATDSTPVDGFGNRNRLKKLFESVAPLP